MSKEFDISYQDYSEWLSKYGKSICENCGSKSFVPPKILVQGMTNGDSVHKVIRNIAFLSRSCNDCGLSQTYNLAIVQQSIIRNLKS